MVFIELVKGFSRGFRPNSEKWTFSAKNGRDRESREFFQKLIFDEIFDPDFRIYMLLDKNPDYLLDFRRKITIFRNTSNLVLIMN